MSTARKILSNTGYQVFGRAITAVISIFTVKILTNYLQVADYGYYTTIYSFLSFFAVAADLGLFTIAVREMSKDEKNIPMILGNVLSLRTVLTVFSVMLAVIVAFLIPNYRSTPIPLGVAIAGASTLFFILAGTISSVLQVHLKMQYSIFGLVMGRIGSFLYMLWVVFVGFPHDVSRGFIHLIVASIINGFIMLVITYFFSRKFSEIRYRFDWQFWKNVLFRSLPYGIALILSMIYFQIDTVLLSIMKGPKEAGIYGVPMKILEILNIVPVFFMNSVLPVLTRHLKEQSAKVKDIIQYSFDFLVITSLPIVVGAYVLAYPITFVIASPEFLSRVNEGFYGSDIGIKILMIALFFAYINSLFGFTLVALNRQADLMKINAGCVIFNIVANLFVIPQWGFRGAGVTTILSEMFILIFTSLAVHKYIDYRLLFGRASRALFSVVIMGLFIYSLRDYAYSLIQNYLVLVLVPLGAVVYGIMLILTKAVTKDVIRIALAKDVPKDVSS